MEHNPIFEGAISEREFATWLTTAFGETMEYSVRVSLRLRRWNIQLDKSDKEIMNGATAMVVHSLTQNYTGEILRLDTLALLCDLLRVSKRLDTKYAPTGCQCSTCVMLDIDYEHTLELISALAAVEVTAE